MEVVDISIKYVGGSKNIWRRWQEHIARLGTGTHHNKQMQALWDEGKRFTLKALEFVDDPDKMIEVEQRWIDTYRDQGATLLNIMTADHLSRNGIPMPEEAIERTRQANVGRKDGEERIRKAVEARKRTIDQKKEAGTWNPKKTRAFQGKAHTPETLEKMSMKRKEAWGKGVYTKKSDIS